MIDLLLLPPEIADDYWMLTDVVVWGRPEPYCVEELAPLTTAIWHIGFCGRIIGRGESIRTP